MKKVLLAALLLTLPGFALGQQEAAVEPVRSVAEKRERLEAELEEVAARIEARKAAARQGGRSASAELEALLRRSQALAEELAALHREEEAARLARKAALEVRLEEQEALLERARRAGDAAGVASHQTARDKFRAELQRLQPVREGRVALPKAPKDDPEELAEQADLLRDQRDRVLARLTLVEDRLVDAREEARVARELRDFVDEAELFDDGERLMRASRVVSRPGAPTRGSGDGVGKTPNEGTAGGDDSLGPDGSLDSDIPMPAPSPAPAPPPPPEREPVREDPGSAPLLNTRLFGTRPLGSEDLAGRRLPSLDGDESLDELLEQQRALRDLAGTLEAQAADLERRAARLAAPGAR